MTRSASALVPALLLVCASCTDDGSLPGFDAAIPDGGPVEIDGGHRIDANVGIPDAARPDAGPPRTMPCEPRVAPIACNPRRIEDACAAFGEECTNASSACVPRRPAGELCRFDQQCAEGLACTATIGYGVCAPPPVEGEACARVCDDPDRLFCDLDASPPICAARRGEGERCSVLIGSACRDGLFCDVDGRCAAPRGVGGTCASSGECESGLTCAAGACAEPPTVGTECTDVCASGAFCDITEAPATCRPRIADGQPCPSFGVDLALGCADGLQCFFDAAFTGVCAAPVARGGVCSLDRVTCAAGLVCEDGVCADVPAPPVPPIGAPCEGNCGPDAFCAGVPPGAGICWSPLCEVE